VLGLVEVDMSSGLRLRPSSSLSSWMERVPLQVTARCRRRPDAHLSATGGDWRGARSWRGG
jgi:hypothetical protein